MKSLSILLIIIFLSSCGEKQQSTQQKYIPQEEDSLSSFPYLHLKKVERVKIILENKNARKEYVSLHQHPGKKDFLHKNTLMRLNRKEKKSEPIEHKDYLIYYSDLFTEKEYVENYFQKMNYESDKFDSGEISLRANFELRNLNKIELMEELFVSIFLINTKDWSKTFIKKIRLFKYGQDPDVIHTNGRNEVNPRQAHTIRIENLTQGILHQLITGESKLGFLLTSGKVRISNLSGIEAQNLQYEKIISHFFNSKKFLYISNNKNFNQIIRKENESLAKTLERVDSAVEISQDGEIQYLNGFDSSLPHHFTEAQVLQSTDRDGVWKKRNLHRDGTIVLQYQTARALQKMNILNEPLSARIENFASLDLASTGDHLHNRRVVFFAQGVHEKPLYSVVEKRAISKVDEPRICHRNFDRYNIKAECLGKDLSCYFSSREKSGFELQSFSENEYQSFLNIQQSQKKLKIQGQWYSKELGGFFIVAQIEAGEEILSLQSNIQRNYGLMQLGIVGFNHCPSRKERGFHLQGEIYPAITIRNISVPRLRLILLSNHILNKL